jgi:hypothetical protein
MKITLAAAGALLLGTSATAWAAGGSADPSDQAWKDAGVKSSAQLKAAVSDVLTDAKAEPTAWADQAFAAEPAAWTEEEWKVQPASAAWIEGEPVAPTDDKLVAKDEPKPVEDGVGGPLEPAEATTIAATDLAPRPATANYPPCDPGPGDDNCIQLYEPGVRATLASWNAPTGGLADNSATTAMGGPYEPVDDMAATENAELATADDAYAGTGGPIAETGYPPCRSDSDDRCIQLYEPGVTGEGN